MFMVLFIALTAGVSGASAQSDTLTNEEWQTLASLKKDLADSSQKIQQLVISGKEHEAENLPKVQEAKKTLESNPKLYAKFISEGVESGEKPLRMA
ncbi:hypothetical protein ACFO8Q_09850 [Effusibacillus consociatus]|uniref:DUF2680 domain-containing protein n=1 Tax=Effusibacillus consociatus TaxID=1117041 RepID=A0ABV9Q1J3_9BACL